MTSNPHNLKKINMGLFYIYLIIKLKTKLLVHPIIESVQVLIGKT